MAALGCILLLFITVLVCVEVFSRYFFDYSFIWVNEITEYSLLYITCLGGAWLLRKSGHITIDIIDFVPSEILHRIIQIFVPIAGIIVSGIITWYGILTTVDLYERNVTSVTTLATPQVYIYVVIPVSFFVIMLEFIRMLYFAVVSKSVNNGGGLF